jgi:hemin uptake protein HemP
MATEHDNAAMPAGETAVVEPAAKARPAAAAGKSGARDGTPRVVTSESLLNGATQLAILHDRTLYYLRQTRFGKLILTK